MYQNSSKRHTHIAKYKNIDVGAVFHQIQNEYFNPDRVDTISIIKPLEYQNGQTKIKQFNYWGLG